ncbi:MAG: hypothetical protein ACM3JI_02935 [Anaerolineae bacterium]
MGKKYYFIAASLIILVLFTLWRFFTPQYYLFQMPITMTPSGCPAITAVIEKQTYLLKFDLGSKFSLSLDKDILEAVQSKKSYGVAKWRDVKGNFYESPSYIIPRVKIGDLLLIDTIVKQEDDIYKINTTLWNNKENEPTPSIQHFGTLGRPLLEKKNLLLDFKNSLMFVSNDIKKLKENGYNLNKSIKVSFQMGRTGIILLVNTDIGTIKLSIDTGSTVSLVRSSIFQNTEINKKEHGIPIYTTSKFAIGNKDFGNKDLFLYDITSELNEIDGVLGMDFLKKHVVYIDYKNKVLYIGDSESREQDIKKM